MRDLVPAEELALEVLPVLVAAAASSTNSIQVRHGLLIAFCQIMRAIWHLEEHMYCGCHVQVGFAAEQADEGMTMVCFSLAARLAAVQVTHACMLMAPLQKLQQL